MNGSDLQLVAISHLHNFEQRQQQTQDMRPAAGTWLEETRKTLGKWLITVGYALEGQEKSPAVEITCS